EREFFARVKPWGFILFARNIVDSSQVRGLAHELRSTVRDRDAPILVDQEGGRVARLKQPHWKTRAAAGRFGELFAASQEVAREAAYLNARLIARELSELGINVNCAPVLDVPVEGADGVIGDRAFGRDPAQIIELGRSVIQGLSEGGVLPVMKHVPGHGRAMA